MPEDRSSARTSRPENFGRIAAQTAKQVILQRIREAEREMMYDEYVDRVSEVVTGIVQQAGDRNNVLVDLGKVEALLPRSEQVDGERYEQGSRIKAVITEVRSGTKGPQVILSRRDPELIKTLFELEVPEIADGLVEIRGVAREPGYRSKIAVESHAQGVDPVGACVGPRGSRVRMVVSELRGEKIDIIPWNPEPARFVAKALSPARVREVFVDDETSEATVVVPDDQLALAIGKEGLNARLAARLTGWKIDIQSDTEFAQQPRPRPPTAGGDATRSSPAAAPRSSRTASAARTPRCPARATAASRRTRSSAAPSRPTRRERRSDAVARPRRPRPFEARRSPRRPPRPRSSRRPSRAEAEEPAPRRAAAEDESAPSGHADQDVRRVRPQGAAVRSCLRFAAQDGDVDPGARRPGRGAYTCRRLPASNGRPRRGRSTARCGGTSASTGLARLYTELRHRWPTKRKPEQADQPRAAARPGGRKRRVVIDSGGQRRATRRQPPRPRPPAAQASAAGRRADGPRHGPVGRHRQGPLAGAGRSPSRRSSRS